MEKLSEAEVDKIMKSLPKDISMSFPGMPIEHAAQVLQRLIDIGHDQAIFMISMDRGETKGDEIQLGPES